MDNIKVYKTSITERLEANSIRQEILKRFEYYEINFDLEDCDNVLRVESLNGPVDESVLKHIFENHGQNIEPLL